jgi:microcystin-dependent protein
MADPFIAELRLFSFGFAPKGWATCDGQLLPINQNQALFSLLGTTYGGNGQTTFGLPNLDGRVPIHFGDGFTQGQVVGEATHTLTISEMPAHNHIMGAYSQNASGQVAVPTNNVYGDTGNVTNLNAYSTNNPGPAMNPAVISNYGGSQAHPNQQPYLVLNWCIALTGIFPSQN